MRLIRVAIDKQTGFLLDAELLQSVDWAKRAVFDVDQWKTK